MGSSKSLTSALDSKETKQLEEFCVLGLQQNISGASSDVEPNSVNLGKVFQKVTLNESSRTEAV